MGGSYLPPSWHSPRGRAGWLCTCILVLLLLLWQPLTATAQASQPTTPIDSFVSQTLLPLAEQALASSETSDAKLQALESQKKIDDAQRQKEQTDSEERYKTLSGRADQLQTFSDSLLAHLGSFSGSEEQKQAAALAAVDKIKADAVALQRERDIWRIVGIGGGAAAVIAIIVAIAR